MRKSKGFTIWRRAGLAVAMAATVAVGCGGKTATTPAGSSDSDAAIGSETAGSDAAAGDAVKADGSSSADGATVFDAGAKPTVTEDFWVVYGHRYRIPGGATTANDLVLTSWKNPLALDKSKSALFGIGVDPRDGTKPGPDLTSLSFKNAGALKDIGCHYSCMVSPHLNYMAIATGQPTAKGYTFQIAALNPQLQVTVGKFGQIKDVAHLEFANEGADAYLFYSTPAVCNTANQCQYDIHRVGPLGQDSSSDTTLTRMAPDDDPDVVIDTNYRGFFQVSEDASTLIFLTTTIRSVKVYAWRGGNVSKLDYICENPAGDSCVGTGSQYHDNDRVGVSADGRDIVLFTIVDRWLRARKYHLCDASEANCDAAAKFSNLVEVPSNTNGYLSTVCSVLKPFQSAEVHGQPYFSADGKYLYFLGYSQCPKGGIQKPWTDLYALEVAKIGQAITEQDWINLTHNPRDNSCANHVINDFAMSPGKQVVIMSATASIGQSGSPLGDTDNRCKSDTELYSLIVGDSKAVQFTNQDPYATDTPQTVFPVTVP